MLPTPEKSGTALEAQRPIEYSDYPDPPMSNDNRFDLIDDVDGLSEFERRTAATGLLLRNAGAAGANGYRVARRELGAVAAVVLTWSRVYGGRLAGIAGSWLRNGVAWSRVAVPRSAARGRVTLTTLARITGHTLMRSVATSTRVVGHGARIGWFALSATGRGGLNFARRCVARGRPSRRRHTRSRSRWSARPRGPESFEPAINLTSKRVNLQSAARDAWKSEQEQGELARAAFREAREEYEGAILRRLMERRLGVQVFPRYPEVTVDGLRFVLRWHPEAEAYELTLLTSCPGCGAMVASGDILHLADLGSVLDDVAAGRNRCPNCHHVPASVPRMFNATEHTEQPDRVIEGPGVDVVRSQTSSGRLGHPGRSAAPADETAPSIPIIPGAPNDED